MRKIFAFLLVLTVLVPCLAGAETTTWKNEETGFTAVIDDSASLLDTAEYDGVLESRIVYALALRFNMPAFMLKAVSSVIVVLAISGPYLRKQIPLILRRWKAAREGRTA